MKIYAMEVCTVIALILCLMFTSAAEFEVQCEDIRSEVLRLHVLANSDSDEDQELKLLVRDAVLLAGEECFGVSDDVDTASYLIEQNLMQLLDSANAVIEENGYDYEVCINIQTCYFNTRTYDDVTLPAGFYEAVTVVIGEGSGANWWCVMFPAMCISAASSDVEIDDVLNSQEVELVSSDPNYEVRFWIVEKYEEFKIWAFGE